ncbi:MAG TPA: HAD family hydrolase, partial [Acidimicrobiales bacterium]|nr:HAD family hydrolase [Acidimicrobiales bacterium]
MARAAAIADVDRTLLTGRPGRILRNAMHRAGVAAPARPLRPAVDAAATAFLSTQLTLLGVHASRGWPDTAVREAAATAAKAVVDDAAPHLRPLLDEHRSAGARILLVSAAPPAIAEPLGALLGADDVVGTGWAGGRGPLAPIEGPLVWARAKAEAGAAWLRAARVSPRSAHAYADNFFAGPLLASVG